MGNKRFLEGAISTHFIDEELDKGKLLIETDHQEIYEIVALLSALTDYQEKKRTKFSLKRKEEKSEWKIEGRRAGLRRFGN